MIIGIAKKKSLKKIHQVLQIVLYIQVSMYIYLKTDVFDTQFFPLCLEQRLNRTAVLIHSKYCVQHVTNVVDTRLTRQRVTHQFEIIAIFRCDSL